MEEKKRFIGLQIQNLRKIHVAQMDFDGKNLIPIYGPNEAGKSTVLLALEILLHGKDALPAQAVTKGEESAVLIGQLNGYEIHRKIKADGTIVTQVKTEQGAVMPSPQAFLDNIAGKLVDPEYLAKLPGSEKKNMLIKYAGIDFTAVDNKIKALRDERTLIGREVKAYGDLAMVEKAEPVSIAALMAQQEEIHAFNQEQIEKASKLEKADEYIEKLEDNISQSNFELEELRKKVQEKEQEIFSKMNVLQTAKSRREELPQPEPTKDISVINEQIKKAGEINAKAAAYEAYCEKKRARDEKQALYNDYNEKVSAAEKEKSDLLKNADLPLKGELEITDAGLSYKGINDENWSDAESIKICCRIAAHFSKDLKAMYIRRGESLDSKSLAELKAFAEENDFQIFIEIVSERTDHEEGFYLEEGQIVFDFSKKEG